MLLLEQQTTKKGRIDENNVTELDIGDDEGDEYNGLVTGLSHVIPTIYQWSYNFNIDLDSYFTSNQIFNIYLFRSSYKAIAYSTIQ